MTINDATESDWDAIKADRYTDNRAPREVIAPPENDPVNQPAHYKHSGDIECIDGIEAMLTKEEFIGYLRGNSLKYRWRYPYKNGTEDLKKAAWYEERLLKTLEADEDG